jgi:pilus assembly protein CpaF
VTGYTTIHAGSARQALTRLRFICQLAEAGAELPMSALNTLVSESVDLVVHCARGPHGPVVNTVLAVEDLAGGAEATQFTVTEVFGRAGTSEPLRWSGQVPTRLHRAFRQAGIDLHELLPTERLAEGRRP